MNQVINRYATPLTLGLFAVSTVSGVALFFHVGQGAFHEMHEWLSRVLLAPFVLHVWKNWVAMLTYVRRRTLFVPAGAALLAALVFAVPVFSGSGGESRFRALQLMMQTPLADLAPVLKTTPDELQARLRQHGYKVASAADTLDSVATAAGVPPMKLLSEVIPAH
jgi:hypothetical protein